MKQQGFTLIELMIVVAIIAILAAIAVPAYQTYTIKAQVAEGITLASGAKTAMAEFYASQGEWPADNDDAGLPDKADIVGKYVASVDVGSPVGAITVRFGPKAHKDIDGKTLVFVAEPTDGSLAWTCDTGSLRDKKYLPPECRPGKGS
jgi:type IV pilus assembly protein PilA